MSEESRIYGCIIGISGPNSDWTSLYRLNQTAVEALPAEDEYPPLTCGMLTVPMDYGRPVSAFYREQVIHFGASFNHLSEYWHQWLTKFEGVLRRLYWVEARLHLEMELYGNYEYHWSAAWDGDQIPWLRIPPQPTTKWTFEGGPRDFRDMKQGDAPAGGGK